MDNNDDFYQNILQGMAKDYRRYKFVTKLAKSENNAKFSQTLELVFLSMANDLKTERTDPIFVDVPSNHKHYMSVVYFCTDLQYSHSAMNKFINNIIDKIKKFLLLKNEDFKLPKKYGNINNLYYCGKFNKKINPHRLSCIKAMVDPKYEKYIDLLILNSLLRHESCLSIMYQTTLPIEFYKLLYEKYGVRYEALSTPFNCNLLLYGTNVRFCSLFYDTDKYFGSLGNFFTVDFSKITGIKNIFVYSSSPQLLSPISQKFVYNHLNDNSVCFFIVQADMYKDRKRSKYFLKLLTSDKLTWYTKLKKDSWDYENVVSGELSFRFKFNNELNILVLNGQNKNRAFYRDIITILTNSSGKEKEQELIQIENLLCLEYKRYLSSINLLNLYDVNNKEWLNIIERFINALSNTIIDNSNNEDVIFKKIPGNHQLYKTLLDEITEKYLKGSDQIIRGVKQIVDNFDGQHIECIFNYGKNGDIYYYGNIKHNINISRQLKLINKLHKLDIVQYYIQYILLVVIRYEAILAGNQHWNIPYKWYKYINKMYNVKLEGFASPLNSQLLMIDDNAFFCSLFYDTDKYFGSVGSLFELDIKDFYNKNKDLFRNGLSVALNPPFIPFLIKKTVDLIETWFTIIPNLRFFFGLPYWTDFEEIVRIQKNKYLVFEHIFKRGEYYYEQSFNGDIKQIYNTGKYGYALWVLSNVVISPSEKPYDSMIKYFTPDM